MLADAGDQRVDARRFGALECAAIALMSELGLEHVESDIALLWAIAARGHELEFRVRIDESADEPCACDTIYMDALPSDPDPLAILREAFSGFVTLDAVRRPQARLQARHEPLGSLPSERVEE